MSGLPAWAQVSPKRLAHIERVAMLMDRWAREAHLAPEEQARWQRAAWLHDALRGAPEALLAALAPEVDGPAELRHGPAVANRLWAEGERDVALLDAIRHHSLGFAAWAPVGDALYCADFLDPGRPFEQEARAALAARFPAERAAVLREVVRWRLRWALDQGWAIPEQSIALWNRAVAS